LNHPTSTDRAVLLKCLLENIPDRIFFKDRESRFIYVSRAEAAYLRLADPVDAIGRSDFDFFEQDKAAAARADECRIIETGEPMSGKVERKELLDGRTGWALVSKIPLRDESGAIVGTCGISKDITPLKNAEEALAMANESLVRQKQELQDALDTVEEAHEQLKAAQQRLVELENVRWIARLAYSVAHEVRNPLNILSVGLDVLRNDASLARSENGALVLEEMSQALRRSDTVISALIEGAGATMPAPDPAEIASTLDEALEMMKKKGGAA
jgi:PAS domain S-box-containing protein